MNLDDMREALEVIEAGACDNDEKPPDPALLTTSEELESGTCDDGESHRVLLGMTGDCWPAFCTKCKRYAKETRAFPDNDEEW
jgi:hypothetical protein